MRLLIDNCLSRNFAERIAAAGHDVVWAGEWGPDPGDDVIMKRAFTERRVIVTRDQDFATLALAYGHRHAGLVRIFDTSTADSVAVCLKALADHEHDLERGGIVVAYLHRSRLHDK